MKNVLYLILAIILFGLAYYIWVIAQENGITGETRGLAPRSAGPPPSSLALFMQQWQPILTLLSSLGGVVSFILQIRVWMRGRA